jgi:hypothetical protein
MVQKQRQDQGGMRTLQQVRENFDGHKFIFMDLC